MKVVGIVPARGGSKGIPLKNIAPCNGKPLIYWTIKEAKRSSLDALYVSTDCEQIADYVTDQGVEVLWRPSHLASDTARTIDVLRFHPQVQKFDAVFTLQPTNPLRTATMIDNACCLLEDGDGVDNPSAIISMRDVGETHPARMYECLPSGMIRGIGGDSAFVPRQDLPKLYIRSGEVYLTKTEYILAGDIEGPRCLPYFIGEFEGFNVDKEEGLAVVEALMKARG